MTGVLDRAGRPAGMRVIVRREKPHPGTQLRITDRSGWRLIAFATNTTGGQLADRKSATGPFPLGRGTQRDPSCTPFE